MSKRVDKILAKWRVTGQPIPIKEVYAVLEEYLNNYWRKTNGTSHQIQIEHPILSSIPCVSNPLGVMTICVDGNNVKPLYCRRLLKVIDALKDNSHDKENLKLLLESEISDSIDTTD